MERIYINRDCCAAYVVLALHSILNSGNKERTINDFIEEIKTMFELHMDEEMLMRKMTEILKKEGNKKVTLITEFEKIGITIEECAEYLGISKQLVAELVKLPDFPCVKFKRRILINKNKISDWLDRNTGKFLKY